MRPRDQKQLDLILERMSSDDSIDAPGDVLKYAKSLFATRQAQGQPSLFRRVMAILQADIAFGETAFGERSAGEAKARQMLFQTEEYGVDLRVKPDGEKFVIHGQILGDSFENGTATIANDSIEVVVAIDAFSEFRTGKIAPGKYSLTLKGSETEIVIDSLQL